jgi:DNA segregation ATPase FtsK/SpoIIIE, S-DNA-T family
MGGLTVPVGTLAGLLVGLWLLAPVALGAGVLAWQLLGWLVRTHRDRRHPERVAVRDQTRQARRLAAEWPLLAQTLRLGYTDQWTRQHRFPAAEFTVDGQGVTATGAAIAGASLVDYQRAAAALADTWGCVNVRAEQRGPGLIVLRGLRRDPLLAPARADLSGHAPASLTAWWLGWAEDARPVLVRLAEVSGMVVAGLAGFGKTMLVAHLLGQLAPSPAVQLVLVDGKGGPDYDHLFPRAWLWAKDDLTDVREVLRRVHRLMADRQAAIARVLGVTDAWHRGPSPSWPLVLVVIDEAHTFFHERKGTAAEVKAHNALVAETARLVEELVRKGRNVAVQVLLLTQRATGDAIPTRIRDNCQVAISFATRTVDGAVAALGEEIRQHPDASPVLLNDPAYVGVAVTSLPGRPGFHRVRTPRSTTPRSPRSSAPPPRFVVIRRRCWPSRHRGCGSCPSRRHQGRWHERARPRRRGPAGRPAGGNRPRRSWL